jgi:hypothetical protein
VGATAHRFRWLFPPTWPSITTEGKPLDLLQVSAKRARASVDVDAFQASPCECVDAFPRAGVAGDPTPVGRSRA